MNIFLGVLCALFSGLVVVLYFGLNSFLLLLLLLLLFEPL